MILVTGSKGLIGTALIHFLHNSGYKVSEFDIRNDIQQDIRNPEAVKKAVRRVDGIVHLSAVSRVVWAQKQPEIAYSVNVGGLKNILAASSRQEKKTMDNLCQ